MHGHYFQFQICNLDSLQCHKLAWERHLAKIGTKYQDTSHVSELKSQAKKHFLFSTFALRASHAYNAPYR